MEKRDIQKKFSLIYSIVNFVFWFYIVFLVCIFIGGILVFIFNSINWWTMIPEIFHSFWNPYFWFFAFGILFFILLFLFVNIFLLYYLKKLSFSMKNWEIFTYENKKSIKIIFIFFAIIFIFSGIIFSWWIISIVALLFVWILYEIFSIWFDYKLKNDKLEEENNLTI